MNIYLRGSLVILVGILIEWLLNEKKIIMNAETQTVELCETDELSDNTKVNHED